ncbi:MAG: phosphate ABC transporter permease PstA [Acidilobaceae archaeon]
MDRRKLVDKVFVIVVCLLAVTALAPVFHIIFYITYRGLPVILESGLEFFTSIPAPVVSPKPGGIAPALVGTILMSALATVIAVPLSVAAAVFATEFPNSSLARSVRATARSLIEIPTILIGMLVFVLLVVPLGQYTGLAGAMALAIVMVPYVYTYTEQALQQVPRTYIEAGYSIGLKRLQVVSIVSMRIAARGVARGVTIGISKAVGETAPLIFTVLGIRSAVNFNPLEPMDAVPLLIFQFIQTPFVNWQKLAWGAAFTLLVMYLAIFIVSRILIREVRR